MRQNFDRYGLKFHKRPPRLDILGGRLLEVWLYIESGLLF